MVIILVSPTESIVILELPSNINVPVTSNSGVLSFLNANLSVPPFLNITSLLDPAVSNIILLAESIVITPSAVIFILAFAPASSTVVMFNTPLVAPSILTVSSPEGVNTIFPVVKFIFLASASERLETPLWSEDQVKSPLIVIADTSPLSILTLVNAWLFKFWAEDQVSPPDILIADKSPPSISNAVPSISCAPAVNLPVNVYAPIFEEVNVSAMVTFPSAMFNAVWPSVPVMVNNSSLESQTNESPAVPE